MLVESENASISRLVHKIKDIVGRLWRAVIQPCQPDYDMASALPGPSPLDHGNQKPLYDDPEKRKLMKLELIGEIERRFDMPASRISETVIARTDFLDRRPIPVERL